MAARRSVDLPSVSSQLRTTTQELPVIEDQIRDYRNGQRRRYNT